MILLAFISTSSLINLGIILGLIIVVLILMAVAKAKKIKEENGPLPEKKVNYFGVFIGMLVIAGIIVALLKFGLQQNIAALNSFLFISFPYLAFGIFILGTIYRYKNRGFQVSSLSTQFLEGKQLFWASQPFHWGMVIIFLGHLIAFLTPSAIIAWNGDSLRLLILEISSFAFGLSALLGLILLVKRRLSSQRLTMVANKMDMLVYVVLFTQIISGLSVAYFARWGSTWFATSITPYLTSIFAFNPDLGVVNALPWFIQIHIISAFFIIAIIPFTRFMHFLVAPIDYIWRDYQLVIWNWNKKKIRKSTTYFPGKEIKNH
ncbi:MAG: respiratory nitrate reductase subunit gamma [Flavobacteriales bacterium CG_4_10_14_0_2_um_filter_32_8]|nr:MAG: respiratory nitrate reductase subunit gamma [Flavobacteriales bacterium CG_4_10_14_0_2_um_filter_32_8]PJB14191.1 MAG: respiratory nitrate reductase subunit gamma [Flavobacteriales bacterium CG_4_9_14_3_um_filter_32_8]